MAESSGSLRFSDAHGGRRTFVDLCIAFCIALALLVLNVFVNLSDSIRVFFSEHSKLRITGVLVNGLFVWLAALLWLAFRRWRGALQRRAELEDILSSISPDALLVVDRNRTIQMCNSSVQRVLGFTSDEVINRKTDMLYFDRRANSRQPHEIYEALERDGFHVGVATGKRKGGGTVPLEVISGELAGRSGAVLLLRDISERLRLEEERHRLELRAQQTQKLESLGVLAGGVAHDFNNLLMVIQGHSDLALMSLSDHGPVRDSILEIEKATSRAAQLCSRLLSYSGKTAMDLHDVNLSAIAKETGRMLSVSLSRNAIVKYRLDEQMPAIQGDVTQIHQVVMNLINNAVEALNGGEGVVTVSTGVRECDQAYLNEVFAGEALSPGPHAFLEVQDTGCGMSEETKLKIFDPFFTTKPTGHGMGLAAVLGIVRGHRGGLRVDSKPAEGSKIAVLFPCAARLPAATDPERAVEA